MSETENQVTKTREEPTPLIQYLIGLHRKKELGPLAELRREAGAWPKCGERALRHVVKFFPSAEAAWRSQIHEDALLLTAVLFSLNPSDRDPDLNMGDVMRMVGRERGSPEAVEARFLRLLGARDPAELATHLRYAVQLAAGSRVDIGWSRLERDLRQLLRNDDDSHHQVMRRWSRSFWQSTVESTGSSES